jgi:peptidase M28-like protein/type IX secretion system substrate protein/carboxypeptidase family protein
MKKYLIIWLIFIFLIPLFTRADQLVFATVEDNNPVEKQLLDYKKPVFYEDRFLLFHESDDWSTAQSNQEILSGWDDAKYYFVLYPIREYNKIDIKNFATILKSTNDYLIIETDLQILNDHEIFHPFKIARVFNQTIKTIDESPLPFSSKSILDSSVIQQMVDTVSVDSVWQYITDLQNMERYTTNASAINSSNYLKSFFESLGYDSVYFHTWQSGSIPNVVAVKYGVLNPEEIYVVGGHYDTYANGAPGADDNGSGSASIMEMARVMAPLTFKRTLKCILFSGEELGLLGSAAYASQAASNGDNILGMLNMDMIAYVQPGDQIDVDVVKNTASQDLYDAYLLSTQTYVPTLPIVIGSLPFGASSDHASFWNNGFKAIFPFEDSDNYSPYIHSSQDVVGTSANNQTIAELGTKSGVAFLASMAEIADSRIAGNIYSAVTTDPIANAKIIFNGDSVFTNPDGSFMTPELTPDNYQIIISAVGFEPDTIGHYLNQYEVFNIHINLIPIGIMRPYIHISNITIDDDSTGGSQGNDNAVADAGETVEISANFINTGNLNAINITGTIQTASSWVTVLQDSFMIDSVLIDSISVSNNSVLIQIDPETPAGTEVSFSVNLNYHGFVSIGDFDLNINNFGDILIVEDDDNEGGLAAYTATLDSLNITYDVATADVLQSEMTRYEYMIWFCGDDYSGTLTGDDQVKLGNYLDNGGKLFITGVDIGYDINTDPFYTNYLKSNYLADGPSTATTLVYGTAADPIAGDFVSGLVINDNYVDQITPAGGATQIFNYDYNSGNYGCGVKYDGTYQLVYLAFTLENIVDINNRITLFDNVWNWFGGNLAGVENKGKTVHSYHLSQNYPNPFNPITTIQFSITKSEKVHLEIYNVLGQKVETLISKNLNAGVHKTSWNASNFASGVYFYKIKTKSFEKTKKLILLR